RTGSPDRGTGGMSGWRHRRFWSEATVVPADGGHAVHLDGRPLSTPARAPLVLPTADLARAVAAEWQAVEGEVDPAAMPFTRTANSALDKVAPMRAEVARLVAAYGATDLLCYRAERPEGLVRRQAAWDAPLDWAADELGVRLRITRGVMPIPQDPAA